MTIDGLEKMLRQEVKLSNQQISFNEVRGHDDQYERGYRDALKMVIKNLAELPRGESIPVEWIEDWLDKITGTRDGEDISHLPEQLKFAIQMINLMEMDWMKENGN